MEPKQWKAPFFCVFHHVPSHSMSKQTSLKWSPQRAATIHNSARENTRMQLYIYIYIYMSVYTYRYTYMYICIFQSHPITSFTPWCWSHFLRLPSLLGVTPNLQSLTLLKGGGPQAWDWKCPRITSPDWGPKMKNDSEWHSCKQWFWEVLIVSSRSWWWNVVTNSDKVFECWKDTW